LIAIVIAAAVAIAAIDRLANVCAEVSLTNIRRIFSIEMNLFQ
jgi:hypothetical protein